jgi:hypothetical protein
VPSSPAQSLLTHTHTQQLLSQQPILNLKLQTTNPTQTTSTTMKFISLILAATASVMIAATPLTSPNVATNVFARDDCKICDDFYQKCRGVSISLSWLIN